MFGQSTPPPLQACALACLAVALVVLAILSVRSASGRKRERHRAATPRPAVRKAQVRVSDPASRGAQPRPSTPPRPPRDATGPATPPRPAHDAVVGRGPPEGAPPPGPTSRVADTSWRHRRGMEGEAIVRAILDEGGCRAIHDVTIPTEDEKGTQIDHVAVIGRLLCCIETKCWSGEMHATQNDKEWRVVTGEADVQVRSPLRQNEYHREQLDRAVGRSLRDVKGEVRGYVVMVGTGTLLAGNRRLLLEADGLRRWIAIRRDNDPDVASEEVFDRVMAVAAEQEWTIGAFAAHPSCAAHEERWALLRDGPSMIFH